jgi:hypothetical protein
MKALEALDDDEKNDVHIEEEDIFVISDFVVRPREAADVREKEFLDRCYKVAIIALQYGVGYEALPWPGVRFLLNVRLRR